MQELIDRILKDGCVIDNKILKIDNFLNQQLDIPLLNKMGQEIAYLFAQYPIDRIITIETSGIAVAYATALALHNVPVVFARKHTTLLTIDDQYTTSIYSYTKGKNYTVTISKQYLPPNENILIVDDFLASGAAALGLTHLVQEAGSKVIGLGVIIEKAFQHGRACLEKENICVKALASIQKFENNRPVFIHFPAE
ncbi:xanthine phosphoribosyltransferase [Megasphaera sp. UPII 135-E]|uniref:xanthine phosphoribosyltransferase n=1 Tax=Megasphaera sp. UPII 135-E TaxID=1000569 RepID=UPI00021A225A|nr:xanthine phosphoribosyltransferase [Megasphaera sp. UPII 135-E]EGS32191.1 xanthine phosphoribosyltransferase [Megasphaera sp. UPII 135-E]